MCHTHHLHKIKQLPQDDYLLDPCQKKGVAGLSANVRSCLKAGGSLADHDDVATNRSISRTGEGQNHVVAAQSIYWESEVIAWTKSTLSWDNIGIIHLHQMLCWCQDIVTCKVCTHLDINPHPGMIAVATMTVEKDGDVPDSENTVLEWSLQNKRAVFTAGTIDSSKSTEDERTKERSEHHGHFAYFQS